MANKVHGLSWKATGVEWGSRLTAEARPFENSRDVLRFGVQQSSPLTMRSKTPHSVLAGYCTPRTPLTRPATATVAAALFSGFQRQERSLISQLALIDIRMERSHRSTLLPR